MEWVQGHCREALTKKWKQGAYYVFTYYVFAYFRTIGTNQAHLTTGDGLKQPKKDIMVMAKVTSQPVRGGGHKGI